MEFNRTKKFFNKEYPINNSKGVRLRIEDMVIVHPAEESKDPFSAFIVSVLVDWGDIVENEIFIKVAGEPRILMTDELFARLEPVKWSYEKDDGIVDLTLFEE